jgi:protein tyrosine/serine phosphatase
MTSTWRAILGSGIVLIVGVVPIFFYRWVYAHDKRLREIIPGRIYRSGQLTADGFADAVERLGIRTIVNLQDDCLDPDLPISFWSGRRVKESAWCAKLGVKFVVIKPDLVSKKTPEKHPEAIDQLLDLLDDESKYPVLIHCRAGLHRTGVLSAVIRMEYQGWTPAEAYRELKAHGFGEWVCTSANEYVKQYVLNYHPGQRHPAVAATTTASR